MNMQARQPFDMLSNQTSMILTIYTITITPKLLALCAYMLPGLTKQRLVLRSAAESYKSQQTA